MSTLCDSMDCSLLGCSNHGRSQTRILEWVAISFSRGSSRPRDRTLVPRTAGRLFTVWATREVQYWLIPGSLPAHRHPPIKEIFLDHDLAFLTNSSSRKAGSTPDSFPLAQFMTWDGALATSKAGQELSLSFGVITGPLEFGISSLQSPMCRCICADQAVGFCCTMKWIRYIFTYILSLLDLPPRPLHPTPLAFWYDELFLIHLVYFFPKISSWPFLPGSWVPFLENSFCVW